jgi:hypothetical protein
MSTGSPIARDYDECGSPEAPTITHRGVVLGRLCDACAGQLSDTLNSSSDESISEASEKQKNTDQRPRGWHFVGAGGPEDNDNYNSDRQNYTDSSERACSWREMYLKMGVTEVGHR